MKAKSSQITKNYLKNIKYDQNNVLLNFSTRQTDSVHEKIDLTLRPPRMEITTCSNARSYCAGSTGFTLEKNCIGTEGKKEVATLWACQRYGTLDSA